MIHLVEGARQLIDRASRNNPPPSPSPSPVILDRSQINIDRLKALANEPYKGPQADPLTRAGHALTKHANDQRNNSGNSPFPKLSGNNRDINRIGQQQVEEILTSPNTVFTSLGRGGIQAMLNDGRGIRFNSDGRIGYFIP